MTDRVSGTSLQMAQTIDSIRKINQTTGMTQTGPAAGRAEDAHELKKACAELESLFIFHLLKEMRSSIPKSGFLGGGKGEDLYNSMFDAQIARELASERGIGLSTLLMERLGPSSGRDDKNGAGD
jgi:peptidoglycan hydrolase FlgJ